MTKQKKNNTEWIFFTSSSSLGCSTERGHTFIEGFVLWRVSLRGLGWVGWTHPSKYHLTVFTTLSSIGLTVTKQLTSADQTDEYSFSSLSWEQRVGEITGCRPASPGCGRTMEGFLCGSRRQTRPLKPGSSTSPPSSVEMCSCLKAFRRRSVQKCWD